MDTLAILVESAQRYLSDDDSLMTFRDKLVLVAERMNDNEAKALAHLISQYAIHLRSGGH